MMLATKQRFRDLCSRLGARDNLLSGNTVDGIYNELLFSAYTDPKRHYHDLNHINEGLALIDALRGLLVRPDILEMAWWWHDETYETFPDWSKLNEAKSALHAFKELRELEVRDEICVQVMARIMPTLHTFVPSSPDDRFMVDIDLVRLADPQEQFDVNSENLRLEYNLTGAEFKAGQKEFFTRFMARRLSVFLTDWFREKYENQARKNIERILNS